MRRLLEVYLLETFAGHLIQSQNQGLSFIYDSEYIKQKSMPVSVCMPLLERAYSGSVVKAVFSGVLPDDGVRYRLAKSLGVSENNPFSLLEIVGGECAGALSFYRPGEKEAFAKTEKTVEVLDDQQLEEVCNLLQQNPFLTGRDGMRLSLAGAQDKIAVLFEGGKISLVGGGAPTTHILKTTIPIVEDSVYNEFFCMRLASLVGIETPAVFVKKTATTACFLVERYDRKKGANGEIKRLHQEDFCQAQGILPELKYEREGGPTIAKCQDLLKRFSRRPAIDQMQFLDRVIFNYLIGNADAHGKNFSFLYKEIAPELAPAYDLISTAVYPNLSSKMAMKIGKKYEPQDVYLRHWLRLVDDTEVAKKSLETQLHVLAKNTLRKAISLKEVLRSEGIISPIFDGIISVINERVQRFL
jgi:serine/threonine-protein kinase HipA